MLYQLDLRLKEITQNKDKPFGGNLLFVFHNYYYINPVTIPDDHRL